MERLPLPSNLMAPQDFWSQLVVFGTIYEPLVVTTSRGEYRPHLASKMEVLDNGRRFLFQLRSGIRFHDGRSLTSADVCYTLERARRRAAPDSLDLLAAEMAPLVGVHAPSPQTVELVLNTPQQFFPSVLAEIGILPAPRAREAQGVELPPGTGPFRVSRRTDSELVLERNPRYWGRSARVGALSFIADADPARALSRLRNGEFEMIARLYPGYYPAQVNTSRMRERFRTVLVRPNAMRLLVFNCRRGPLKDRRVRLALIQLLDRDKLLRETSNGLGELAADPFWILRPWHDSTIRPHPYDPASAARLLDAAGWSEEESGRGRTKKGRPLKLSLLRAKDSEPMARVARLLKTGLRSAGIQLEVEAGDFGFVKAQLRRGRFDLVLVGLALRAQSDLSPLLHSSGALNVGSYGSPLTDQLLDWLRSASTAQRRQQLVQQLQRAVYDDPPFAVLWIPTEAVVVRKSMGGLDTTGGRWPSFAELSPD